MQVKRNVPKPGKEAFSESEDEGLKQFTRKGPSESASSNVTRVLHQLASHGILVKIFLYLGFAHLLDD